MPNMKTADTPTMASHPPERRRRTEIRMCHGSACCCCCCVHTVGGIIGAAVAPAFGKNNRMPIHYYYDEDLDISVPNVAKPGASAVKVFWFLSLGTAILGTMLGALAGREGFLIGLFTFAMGFPALQLGCAVVTLIWLGLSSRPDKSFQSWQIGKIAIGLFVGTAAGILAMVVLAVLMSAR